MHSRVHHADGALDHAISDPLVRLQGVSKRFGPTLANHDLSFDVPRGGILGLVGANGAGKSTLVRMLCGIVAPDTGYIEFEGRRLDAARFDPRRAGKLGIRIVHQELSVCSNLSVLENFYLEDPAAVGGKYRWRKILSAKATEAIERIFPEAGIDPRSKIADLSLAQRQMVEIAKASCDSNLKLLILDEPTSSLDSNRSRDLVRYMRGRSAGSVTFIFITHKLREIIEAASSVLVMRSGTLVWQGRVDHTRVEHLVDLLGGRQLSIGDQKAEPAGSSHTALAAEPVIAPISTISPLVTISADDPMNGLGRPLNFFAGEVVGLAGLEGAGQREFLKRIQSEDRRSTAFVAGDRAKDGIFATGTVRFNVVIGLIACRGLFGYSSPTSDQARFASWLQRLRIPADRSFSPIVELSGGNQQKALMARALLTNAPLVMLDDPTRGVDVGVKQEIYAIVRTMSENGTAFLWCSSEDAEFLQCDRVIVFSGGIAAAEVVGKDISEAAIVSASFGEAIGDLARKRAVTRRQWHFLDFVAPATLALVLCMLGIINPSTLSGFGLSLLLSSAVPVVLVSIAQMIIIGGSEIDLGTGAFVGMTSVIGATLLVGQPMIGALGLVAAILGYIVLALVIELCGVPAIVVTLGASFVWLGIGYSIQPTPGGSSPEWLATLFSPSIGQIPPPLIVITISAVAAAVVTASRFGVVLKALGNNRHAVTQLGWPVLWYQVRRYAVAGGFGACAGLSMTAVNSASDANAGSSFTLMSIASVVIGGSMLSGGWIRPFGTACGAVTLSLAGAVLGLLNVSTDFNPAVQGGLLVLILLLSSAFRRVES